MKKVVLFILCLILGIFIYSNVKLNEIKVDNKNLSNEISNLSSNNDKIKEDNLNYEDEINSLKEEKKDKLEELEIWKKAKAKLEKALSS